jgi:hypothetical protein
VQPKSVWNRTARATYYTGPRTFTPYPASLIAHIPVELSLGLQIIA